MGQVIVLKQIRLTRAFQAVESAAHTLDGDLKSLCTVGGGLSYCPEETAMLRSYVHTLTTLLRTMPPAEIDEAGLSDRHALLEAMVDRCAANLQALTGSHPPALLGSTA